MCGGFYQIDTGVFDIVAKKIWVVLYDGWLNVHPSPHDRTLIASYDTSKIVDMRETEYDKIEITLTGVLITSVNVDEKTGLKTFSTLMWAWGDDATKVKGAWRRALINKETHAELKDEADAHITSMKGLSPKREPKKGAVI
jgi:hypothetical protein